MPSMKFCTINIPFSLIGPILALRRNARNANGSSESLDSPPSVSDSTVGCPRLLAAPKVVLCRYYPNSGPPPSRPGEDLLASG
jgi:hypothetical protein